MYKRPVRLGLIGAGRIGKLHAQHIAHRIDHAELTAIADINNDAVQSTARRFGVENTSTSAQDVIDDPNVVAVIICACLLETSLIPRDATLAFMPSFALKKISMSNLHGSVFMLVLLSRFNI